MIILFIIGLLFGGLAVMFALQNVSIITVSFFSWELTGSLAFILMLAIASGILITLLLVLPGAIDSLLKNRKLKKEVERLSDELRKQKELTMFAKTTPPSPTDIERIEHGAIM